MYHEGFSSKIANCPKKRFKPARKRKPSSAGSISLFPAYHMSPNEKPKVCPLSISYCLQLFLSSFPNQSPGLLEDPMPDESSRKNAKKKKANKSNQHPDLASRTLLTYYIPHSVTIPPYPPLATKSHKHAPAATPGRLAPTLLRRTCHLPAPAYRRDGPPRTIASSHT